MPDVWGLWASALLVLDSLSAEPYGMSLKSLIARDSRERPLSRLLLPHHLMVSWWCTELLLAVRRNQFVRSGFVQAEFQVHAQQRMDAMVILRLGRSAAPVKPTRLPFFDGSYRHTDEIDIRLALEVDLGRTAVSNLIAKALAYRNLHTEGIYGQIFGGSVLPVYLAPTARRVAQIAAEWRHAWPDGWGIIGTPRVAGNSPYRVVWGEYRSLMDANPVPLLTAVEQHPITDRVTLNTLMSIEQWASGEDSTGT